MKRFSTNDWNHMHDCILDATWKTSKKNCSRKELEEIFILLSDDMKEEAYRWGMSDTVWRDNFIKWYMEKFKKN